MKNIECVILLVLACLSCLGSSQDFPGYKKIVDPSWLKADVARSVDLARPLKVSVFSIYKMAPERGRKYEERVDIEYAYPDFIVSKWNEHGYWKYSSNATNLVAKMQLAVSRYEAFEANDYIDERFGGDVAISGEVPNASSCSLIYIRKKNDCYTIRMPNAVRIKKWVASITDLEKDEKPLLFYTDFAKYCDFLLIQDLLAEIQKFSSESEWSKLDAVDEGWRGPFDSLLGVEGK